MHTAAFDKARYLRWRALSNLSFATLSRRENLIFLISHWFILFGTRGVLWLDTVPAWSLVWNTLASLCSPAVCSWKFERKEEDENKFRPVDVKNLSGHVANVNSIYLNIRRKLIPTRADFFWQKKKVFVFDFPVNGSEKKWRSKDFF